ncbi:hypothetical protein RJ641_025848 [Dillenia turbinata]|uniref:Uncharacterized protein n=1 Tax=Dillenia turbinata TaxID=194707 RepID=A0AAN8ZNY6_9MAGN
MFLLTSSPLMFELYSFLLSALSLAPTLLLKMPPTSLGWAFVMVSTSHSSHPFWFTARNLTHFCFLTHIWLIFASSIAQLLSILVLFTKEKSSLSILKSPRDPREAKVLVRVEYGVFMSMFVMQLMVLALTCAVQSYRVREYKDCKQRERLVARKRSRRIVEVQEESIANAAKMAVCKASRFLSLYSIRLLELQINGHCIKFCAY